MESLTYLHAVAVLIAAGLAAVAIRTPRSLTLRTGAVALAGLLMVTGYAAFAELLGKPKPVTLEWAADRTGDAVVLAADMREGEAIYLWLKVEGISEPRAYMLPWSMEMAKQFRRANADAERKGAKVRVRGNLQDPLEEQEQMFYVPPPQPLPPKLIRAP